MGEARAQLSKRDRAVLAGGGGSLAALVAWVALQVYELHADVAVLTSKVDTLTRMVELRPR